MKKFDEASISKDGKKVFCSINLKKKDFYKIEYCKHTKKLLTLNNFYEADSLEIDTSTVSFEIG